MNFPFSLGTTLTYKPFHLNPLNQPPISLGKSKFTSFSEID